MLVAMPMKKKILLILSIITWTTTQACICFSSDGNFLKTSKQVDLVAIVHVKDYQDYLEFNATRNQPLSAMFEIVKVLKGKEDRKEIKVFGDDGSLCRPYITNFKKGEYYVIALRKCNERKRSNSITETADDFFIPGCGEFWVQYNLEDNNVVGLINRKRKSTTMTLQKPESLIKGSSRHSP